MSAPLAPKPTLAPAYGNWAFTTTLKVYCGCHFTTHSLSEGEEHARTTGHTLQIIGDIRVK